MKTGKHILSIFLMLIVVSALYRVVPGRPYGFAPQIAMAFFAGAVIQSKRLAFALPILSMVLSDALFQALYYLGLSPMWGFYEGQLVNYLLFGLLTVIGFFIRKINLTNVAMASVSAPTVYFLLSNFLVWFSGGGYHRPKTFEGLILAYQDGLPFYLNSVVGTLFFAGLFFGGYYLIQHSRKPKLA